MKFFWVLSAKKVKQILVVVTALFFTFSIVYAERENIPTFSSYADNHNAIYNVKTEKKQIALTFDISWGEDRPELVLDTLDKLGLHGKATFFISSPWSEDHKDVVQRIVDGGYEIGSHGHKHVNYSKLSDEEIENQMNKAHEIIFNLTGKKPNLIRTPNGDFDNRVLKIADRLGYTVIQWDTDSKDWMNPGVNQIVKRVMDRVHPGDIVLLHASDSCKQTHEALPLLVKQLKQEGYEFKTVSQLISGAKVESNELN